MDKKEERIRRRAHEIWEQEGRPHGRDAEHWHRAASEIEGDDGASAKRSNKSVAESYAESRASPGATGETIPPPVTDPKQVVSRGKRGPKPKL